MKFKKWQWKNILSYGNKLQTYEFSDGPELILVEGENGSGKSAIKEALTISAFGRSNLRKIKDIPNWVNKNAYTYNEFETSRGDKVIIQRGIDPNFTEITINGVPENLPDKRKVDEYLENELLGIDFSIFVNTISLSFDDFKSFVNLSASDKRKIVDPIFGIDILTDMKSNIKDDLKDKRKDLEIVDKRIDDDTDLLNSSVEQLNELTEKLNKDIEDKSSDIKSKIDTKTTKMNSHKKKFNELKKKREKINDKMNEIREKCVENQSKIMEYERNLKIFENDKCPYCQSDLTGDSAALIKHEILEKKRKEEELSIKIKGYKEQAQEIHLGLSIDQDKEKELFYELNSEIKSLQTELDSLKNVIRDDQSDTINGIIKTISNQLAQSRGDQESLKEELKIFEILNEMLSDKGIKRALIDKVIPLLNSRIEEISDRLEFKFNFEFDNEFNPIIHYMGMEISPECLSTGQRKKMNLIVILSFIELIKMKHANMNVMFLDEIFSGLDKNNVYKAIEILREYADKYNMTMFVVSHESLPEEFFDKKMEITMTNHFSEIRSISNTKK